MVVLLVSKDNHKLEFRTKEKDIEKAKENALKFVQNSEYSPYDYKIVGFKH